MKLLITLATAAYPLLVYAGLGRWDPMWLMLGLAALMSARAWTSRDRLWLAAAAGVLLLGGATVLGGSWLPLKLYPVLVSAALLTLFGLSLLHPPTVIERIARLAEPRLDAAGVAYTRRVTVAWCGFFVVNGALSAGTAVWGSDRLWLLYNGFLSYVFIGLFFGGEWLLRRRMRARTPVSPVQHG